MNLYPLVPLTTCLVTGALAAAILARDARQPVNRLAAMLVAGGTWWSFFEVLWNTQGDPGLALVLVKASALGWVWIGPLTLHLFLEITADPMPRVRRRLPVLYGASAVLLLVDWLTPWIHPGVERMGWGFAYRLGTAYVLYYAFTVACFALALRVAARAYRGSASPAERSQARWVSIGIGVPLVVASLTDALLPLAGVQLPRFGAASFVVLAGVILGTVRRFGYSLLAPGDFAGEILEALPDGVALLRLDGSVRGGNAAMARLLGCRAEDLPGVAMGERLSEPLDLAGTGQEQRCDLSTSAGSRLPVAVASRLLCDKRGSPLGLVLVVRDLAEVAALRDRLLLSGRLAAVGELAAGIAHEINNPLAFVRANLSLLRQHWASLAARLEKAGAGAREGAAELVAEGEELVDESLEGVDRAVAIVRDVRGLARAGSERCELADLHVLIEGVLRMAAPQLRDRIRIERRYGAIAPVHGTPRELQQVFLNLVLNAAQAIEDEGTICVATELEGGCVLVHVEDDGCGIAPEHRERIFDPFFTTRPVGQGPGLGLGIAHGIVRSHGGEIRVASRAGGGSRFSVHLPIAADTLAPPA
jgi:signal transduction histidine kinase